MVTGKISLRKKDHIQLCLTDEVSFRSKTNGFENYEFEHNALTEVNFDKINLTTDFFGKVINYPFVISCMTGGTKDAERINEKLATASKLLNIPIGIGSQRQQLENKKYHSSYRVVKKNAGKVPILGNIGVYQISKSKNVVDDVKLLIDLAEAHVMVIHLNPAQELMQIEGETDFKGFLKKLEKVCSIISTPIIIKEVGSGISKSVAKKLLDAGVAGIDVAGAGGTSWTAVELLRRKLKDDYFRDWGLPTSYCIRTVKELKKNFRFTLIASGGINNGVDIAKAIALGAELAASARIILQEVVKNDVEGVIKLIESWFSTVKKIMYLTNCDNIKKLTKVGLINKKEMY
jgi:isopentenyl-diphosphate delta-isomerase